MLKYTQLQELLGYFYFYEALDKKFKKKEEIEMDNKDFRKQCELNIISKSSKVNNFIKKLLSKEGKNIEQKEAAIAILSFILPDLLDYGCILRLTTKDIAEACNCDISWVNRVLGFVGFKYERDRVTHKDEYSKGMFERYYQIEYIDDTMTKKKRTTSVFNIVATEKFFETIKKELGIDVEVDKVALKKLHEESKKKAYIKKVKLETIWVPVVKQTSIVIDSNGTTQEVDYSVDDLFKKLISGEITKNDLNKKQIKELAKEYPGCFSLKPRTKR